MTEIDPQNPATIDVDVVIGNINNSFQMRRQHWDLDLLWPNITVKALADEVMRIRRERDDVLITLGRMIHEADDD